MPGMWELPETARTETAAGILVHAAAFDHGNRLHGESVALSTASPLSGKWIRVNRTEAIAAHRFSPKDSTESGNVLSHKSMTLPPTIRSRYRII